MVSRNPPQQHGAGPTSTRELVPSVSRCCSYTLFPIRCTLLRYLLSSTRYPLIPPDPKPSSTTTISADMVHVLAATVTNGPAHRGIFLETILSLKLTTRIGTLIFAISFSIGLIYYAQTQFARTYTETSWLARQTRYPTAERCRTQSLC